MTDLHSTTIRSFDALLQRGQSLENEGRLEEALSAYDQALACIRFAGDPADPLIGRSLGVALMNRGNILQRLGTASSLTDALKSYDAAIAAFQTLPVDAEPQFRNHLGAAWLNRGHAQLIANDNPAAADSFAAAIHELEQLPLESDPHFRLNLAGAHTNLAHALLSAREQNQPTTADAPQRAADAARAALRVLVPVERTHEAFAGLSLRARRGLVVALHLLIGAAEASRQPLQHLAAEATDAIDDGLAVARDLEQHGFSHHRPLAHRLFRMGVQLYGIHQPHFLAEFILEMLATPAFAADPEFRTVADEALARALATLQRAAVPADPTRALETIRSVRAAQQQLAALPPLS